MIEQLQEQIKVVAEARHKASTLKDVKHLAYEEFEKLNVELLDSVDVATEEVGLEEAKLRELTLEVYAETGNKAPALGVGIREVTKLDYDVTKAFEWALEHRIALQLNKSAFDKLAKTAPETRPSFVMVTTEPQATIAMNLEEKK